MLQIKLADNKTRNSTHTHTRIDDYFQNHILQIKMKPTANAW